MRYLKYLTGNKRFQVSIMADDSSLTVLAANQTEPKARVIKTGQVGEHFEGLLVELSGAVTETSGNTFWISDSSGKAKIYIKDSTKIDKPATPKGIEVKITGIVSQYGDYKDGTPNFRVLPRYQEDLQTFEETPTGTVSGLTSPPLRELPHTGKGDFSLGILILLMGISLKRHLKAAIRTQTTLNRKNHHNE